MSTHPRLRLDDPQVKQIIANLGDFFRECKIKEPTELFMGFIRQCLLTGSGLINVHLCADNQFGATTLKVQVNSGISFDVIGRHDQPLPLLTARLKYYLDAGLLRERLDVNARYLVGIHDSNLGRFVRLISEDGTLPVSKAPNSGEELIITVLPLWNGRKSPGQRRSHWAEVTILEQREAIAFLFIQKAAQARDH